MARTRRAQGLQVLPRCVEENKNEKFPVVHIVKLVEGYTQTLWEAYLLTKSLIIHDPHLLDERLLPHFERVFGSDVVSELKKVGYTRGTKATGADDR